MFAPMGQHAGSVLLISFLLSGTNAMSRPTHLTRRAAGALTAATILAPISSAADDNEIISTTLQAGDITSPLPQRAQKAVVVRAQTSQALEHWPVPPAVPTRACHECLGLHPLD